MNRDGCLPIQVELWEGEAAVRQTVDCGNCGAEVEIADFCSRCGHPLKSRSTSRNKSEADDSRPTSDEGSAQTVAARSLARLGIPDRPSYSWIVDAAVVVILLALLAGNAGLAIVIAVFVVPLLALRFLTELDLFEREPWLGIAGTIAAGFVAGTFVGIINQFFVNEFWIENAPLKIGAAGFGGRFADAEGGPPALVMLVCGFVMPVVAIGLQSLLPVFLRRWPSFRNEVMDGVTLGAAAGFGFAAATAVVYYWPLISDGTNPRIALEDWTATLIGVAVVRPLLFGACTALAGAGIWHYAMTQRSSELTLPVALGVGGVMLFSVGDLLIQTAGPRWEVLWGTLVLFGLLFVSFRLVLRRVLRFDVQSLGGPGQRIVCSSCGRVTPAGVFCANCGRPLAVLAAPEPAASETPASTEASASTEAPTPDQMTAPLDVQQRSSSDS